MGANMRLKATLLKPHHGTMAPQATAPSLPWLQVDEPFPPTELTWGPNDPIDGLLAAGADLSVARLVSAYSQGIFPWYSKGQPILWWSPNPRMVLQPQSFKCHPSLRKTIRSGLKKGHLHITFDHAFDRVIEHCAQVHRPGQGGTWIVRDMVKAYQALHRAGVAHSIEVWQHDELVGGLYGVQLGRMVFGESMFSLQSNASKIALTALVGFARHHAIELIDCQQNTPHLASLGAQEMSRPDFIHTVQGAVQAPTAQWRFDSVYWDLVL